MVNTVRQFQVSYLQSFHFGIRLCFKYRILQIYICATTYKCDPLSTYFQDKKAEGKVHPKTGHEVLEGE